METHEVVWMCLTFNPGVNSSCHVQTTVNVERGIIWGISIYSIHKGEVTPPLVCAFWGGIKRLGVFGVYAQKVPLRFGLRFR